MPFTRIELEQIRNSRQYDDSLPAGSGLQTGPSLQEDIDGIVSQLNKIIGKVNWYEQPSTSLETLNTASGVSGPIRRVKSVLSAKINPGDIFTLPDSASYTIGDVEFRNLQIFRHGILLLPGSGITVLNEDFNDYRELNSTQVVFNTKVNKNEILQFVIFK